MRRFILGTIIGLALLNEGLCFAQALQPPIVVVIEFKEALDQSDFGKKHLLIYNGKVDYYKGVLSQKHQYLSDLDKKLKDPKSGVTQEFYETELRKAQQFTEDSNTELARLKEAITVLVNNYVSEAIIAYTLKNKIDIVIPSTSAATCVTKYNITSSFITYINKEYKKND